MMKTDNTVNKNVDEQEEKKENDQNPPIDDGKGTKLKCIACKTVYTTKEKNPNAMAKCKCGQGNLVKNGIARYSGEIK